MTLTPSSRRRSSATPPVRPRSESLVEAWDRFATQPLDEDRLLSTGPGRHPRGWTRALAELLDPYVHLPAQDGRDVARFRDVPWTVAARLLTLLPADELADRQNCAPSLGALLRACVGNPWEVTVHGYLVPPSRRDERLSVEGIVIYDAPALGEYQLKVGEVSCLDSGCECGPFWQAVQSRLGLDGEGEVPQEILSRRDPATGRLGWYLWWD